MAVLAHHEDEAQPTRHPPCPVCTSVTKQVCVLLIDDVQHTGLRCSLGSLRLRLRLPPTSMYIYGCRLALAVPLCTVHLLTKRRRSSYLLLIIIIIITTSVTITIMH